MGHRLQPLMPAGTSPVHEGTTQTVMRPCVLKERLLEITWSVDLQWDA